MSVPSSAPPLTGGIDLGGTFIKAAVVDASNVIRGRARVATGATDGPEAVMGRMVQALEEAVGNAGRAPAAAGIGVPGLVDPGGRVKLLPNLPGWEGIDVAGSLSSRLGLPVQVDNDASAAAVAEGLVGAAAGRPDYMLVTLGTGVGGGLVLSGRLWRGAHGQAAELGHVKVRPDGRECGCGGRGCVERYASGTALALDGRAAVSAGRLAPPHDGEVTPAWLHRQARAGNGVARELLNGAAAALGEALASVVNLLDVTVFFIGGGVGAAFEIFEPALRRSIESGSFALDPARLHLAAATSGNDAGVIGAAHLGRLLL